MTLLNAAYQVLAAAGKPLHYREITRFVLEQELWQTIGKTPDATLNARLATDVRNRGGASRFRRVSPGVFALNVPGVAPASGASASQLATAKQGLPFLDAAERMLEQEGGRKPMHYRAITERALALGMLTTSGQTPDATMYAQIWADIQRRTKRGLLPRFSKHGHGYFGLAKWLGTGLIRQIEQQNAEIRSRLSQRLLAMSPARFEALIGRLLVALGFDEVSVTPISKDGGIDVRGTLFVGDVIRTRMAVQVKRWKHNVQAQVVQQVRGSLGAHEQGLIITTSDFSRRAKGEAAEANKTPVALMNGDQLVALLIENDIGVRRISCDLIELVEEGEEDEE
jgi:restriction system protein